MTQAEINQKAQRVNAMVLPPLNDNQRKVLLQLPLRISVEQLLYRLRHGEINLADLGNLPPQKLADLSEYLQKWPDPKEIGAWDGVSTSATSVLAGGTICAKEVLIYLRKSLNDYLSDWQYAACASEHVSQARVYLTKIDAQLKHVQETEWNSLDKYDKDALDKYEMDFPGVHSVEIGGYRKEIKDWESTCETCYVEQIVDYLRKNPKSHFASKARERLINKTRGRLDEVDKVIGILSDDEIINNKICNQDELDFIKKPIPPLDDVKTEIVKCMNAAAGKDANVCPDGATDVFFFGVPMTGKSSILMGLTGAGSGSELYIDIDSAQPCSKPYHNVLVQYRNAGKVFPGTPSDFVLTLQATVHGKNKQGKESIYKVNLVEMAGEDFLNKIALNQSVTFDSMGTGAAGIMSNGHYKVIFIIIDPTKDYICNTLQATIVKNFVDLFSRNMEVMKKVKSIHFLITKSDTLKDDEIRKTVMKYSASAKAVKTLADEKDLSINKETNGYPKCYTFSLGKFIGSDRFIYDSRSSYNLCAAIANATVPTKVSNKFRRFLDILN